MSLQETAPDVIQDLLQPIENGSFRFACHPGVPCFTECCRDLRLLLTPYDILRMKTRLGLATDAFIEKYGEVHLDEKRCLPMIHLRMEENERKTCPFVSSEGCAIYEDRPSACRIYPVARASRMHPLHGTLVESYFLLKETHCRGFEEAKEWSVEKWLLDQGLEPYHELNNLWMELITDKGLQKRGRLSEKQQQMFYMVCYDSERFRKFVLSTRFLTLFEIDAAEKQAARMDDTGLLRLGMKWLSFSLLNKPSLKLRRTDT